MHTKDKYILADCIATFLLLNSVILLFGHYLSLNIPHLILWLACGFSFNWFYRNKNFRSIRIGIDIAVLGICVWVGYTILHSTFLFNDVMFILTQGIMFMLVIFSFYSPYEASLKNMRLLSIPLVMSSAFFVKYYNLALLIFYFLCWFIILKINFFKNFQSREDKIFGRNYGWFLLVQVFIAVIFLAFILFYNISINRINLKGFLATNINAAEPKEKDLWGDYYVLQDQVQEEITKIAVAPLYKGDKQKVLYFLSSLIKETPEILEVEKARQGLIDHLRRPGPGLERRAADEIVFLINKYFRKKIVFNLKRFKNNFETELKNNNASIYQRISNLIRINKVAYGGTFGEVEKSAAEVKASLKNSLLSNDGLKRIEGSLKQLQQWKALEFYSQTREILDEKINSLDESRKKEFQEIFSEIEAAEKGSDLVKLKEKIEELQKNDTAGAEQINLAGDVVTLKSKLLPTGGQDAEEEFPQEPALAEAGPEESAGQEETVPSKEEAEGKKPPAYLIGRILFILFLSIFMFLAASYLITKNKKRELRARMKDDPRKFIIDLYGNVKNVLMVFDSKNKVLLTPLFFVRFLCDKYQIKSSTFLKFSEKFAEAKYSHHSFSPQDAALALVEYNKFLKEFCSLHGKKTVYLKNFLLILHTLPFYI